MMGPLSSVSSIPEMPKKLIASASISGSSPETILEQLNKYEIEWYLTEEGDLFIKYWSIGAENFAPPEKVIKLREIGKKKEEISSLDWVSQHLSELLEKHPGKWIAVKDDQVISSSDNLPSLMEYLQAQGIEDPFITEIPAHPVVWNTAYAY
jgi:hypothetical protein